MKSKSSVNAVVSGRLGNLGGKGALAYYKKYIFSVVSFFVKYYIHTLAVVKSNLQESKWFLVFIFVTTIYG